MVFSGRSLEDYTGAILRKSNAPGAVCLLEGLQFPCQLSSPQ